jgi:hypothetical protein
MEVGVRRAIDIATLLFGVWAAVTGIADGDLHAVFAAAFVLLFLAHAFMYRKVVLAHFRQLGWGRVMVGVMLTVMISACALLVGDGLEVLD